MTEIKNPLIVEAEHWNKLIEHIKWLSKIKNVSTFEFPCEFNCNEIIANDAKALLEEIGEI